MVEYPKKYGRNYDPVEDTEAYKKAVEEIKDEIDEFMKDRPDGMGSCHVYWSIKKNLLKKRGIDWKTPSECNPYIMFD
jgi:hypothetical protein